MMIRVAVKKNKVTAVMNVNVERTPYFFRDRDPIVVDGVTKRIFHVVRPHERADGSVVRMHFRGAKQFVWNGYDVSITVPGKDHADWMDASMSGFDADPADPIPKGMMSMPVLARLVEGEMRGEATLRSKA